MGNPLKQELPRHEKIRFRREEITDLATYPSAANDEHAVRPPSVGRRARKIVVRFAATVAAIVLFVAGAIAIVQFTGIGSERLRVAAERALQQASGPNMRASVGPARVIFGGSSLLAAEVRDVKLTRAEDDAPVAEVGFVHFGIDLVPLLSGEVVLSNASASDSRIDMAGLPSTGGDWTGRLRNGQGLVDPDLVLSGVFEATRKAFEALGTEATKRLALENIEFAMAPDSAVKSIRLAEAKLAQVGGGLNLELEADIDGRPLTVAASAQRDPASGRIQVLTGTLSVPAETLADDAPTATRVGSVDVKFSGSEAGGAERARLSLSLSSRGSAIDLGSTRGIVAGDVDFAGVLAAGSQKIDVDRLRMVVGRSTFDFYGSIGPRPATSEPGDRPAYRYDLISTSSVLAPEASPESALPTYIRVAGTYLTAERELDAREIALKSGRGEMLGSLSVRFVPGKAPGMAAAISVHDMPVAHVKQVWPWFTARSARLWVLDHLYGGRVVDGRVSFRVDAGRLGNGVPLNADEVNGTFNLERIRFDTAGLIPPVRDAIGSVEFRGNDVDIALKSGTVFLPSGRTVAASNGVLKVLKANVPPVIGDLDLDVAGDAAAVAELASYDPINAMRFIGLTADDFTGEVSGHVKADIPLQKGVDTRSLRWLVALDYKNLAVAKPLDGQMVTEAEGRITVEPEQALISAKAKLNGIAAEVETVEPLRKDGPDRKRVVRIALDDETREILIPGISTLVSGPMKLRLDALGAGRQKVEADLTDAELNIPWAGWSKGAGIDAKVDFTLDTSPAKATLTDFTLSGRSFAILGDVSLSGGSLAQATFSSLQLNRGDDVAVSVKRTDKGGYAVSVTGDTLDARALIRRYMADTGAATKGTDSGSVSVNLDVGKLVGFSNESLSNVKLDYSGSGDRVNGLKVSAATQSGAAVAITNETNKGQRSLRMTSGDAGAILRFLDIYEHMEGGRIDLQLGGGTDEPMSGRVEARDFALVNEERLGSLVSRAPPGGDQSLSDVVKADINTSRARFDRASTGIEKGSGYLKLSNGVLRGEQIGATFQGTLYDKAGNMDMTGTFMPAYGINRLFGEIPIVGAILGNGRDRGLIGVTFKLEGDADKPKLRINPLSAIAPGIFRSIFEYQ